MTSKNDLVGHKVPPAHLIVRGIDNRFGGLQALKDAVVDEALWETKTYKEGSLLSFSMNNVERFDPPSIFSSDIPEWKFFWKGKDDDSFSFCIGSCLFLENPSSEDLNLLQVSKLF